MIKLIRMILTKLKFAILVLVALAGTIQTANSQAAIFALIFGDKVASEKFNISMEFGVNFSQFSDIPDSKQLQTGLNFGMSGNLMLSQNFFFSPTIYFLSDRNLILEPYSLKTEDPTLDNKYKNKTAYLNLKYIDIPILFSYQTNNKKIRFSLGPSISFLKSSKLKINGDFGDFEEDFMPNINTIDYGLISCIGYSLGEARKGKGIYIQLRYYQGFTDIFKDSFNANKNLGNYFSIHFSLPFITDELAQKNVK